MKHLLVIITLIVFVGCVNTNTNQKLNKPFIKSYYEIKGDCFDSLIEILKPIQLEDDSIKIGNIYSIDVFLDPNIFSGEELMYNYFIGIEFIPDSFELFFLNLNLNLGTIAICRTIENDRLIIENMNLLFTDLSILGDNNCLGMEKEKAKHTKGNRTIFRQKSWTNQLYGEWIPDSVKANKFVNSKFDNSWVFSPEKEFRLIKNNTDTLINESIELNGGQLRFMGFENSFEILTQTKTTMIIKELEHDNVVVLKKQIEK